MLKRRSQGENLNRQRLLALIREAPGIHKSELKRRTGLAWGTVNHHVEALVRQGAVVKHRAGSLAMFACPGKDRADPALLLPAHQRMLQFIRNQTFANQALICRKLDLGREATRSQLNLLLAAGLVSTDGAYHPRYWAAQPAEKPVLAPLQQITTS